MQLVVEIDENDYEKIKDGHIPFNVLDVIMNEIKLPKGHGRIGDLDLLAKRIKTKPPIGEIGKVTLEECYQEVLHTTTLIKADKEGEDG